MDIYKISKAEAICFVCIVIVNHIIINIPETIIQSTGSSAWINVIFISILAIVFVWLISKLFCKFPGKDVLDLAEYICGKWLKVIIGIAFIVLFSIISISLVSYFCLGLKLIYFPNTPAYILIAVFLIATIIANKIGIKSIININLIIVPIRFN